MKNKEVADFISRSSTYESIRRSMPVLISNRFNLQVICIMEACNHSVTGVYDLVRRRLLDDVNEKCGNCDLLIRFKKCNSPVGKIAQIKLNLILPGK